MKLILVKDARLHVSVEVRPFGDWVFLHYDLRISEPAKLLRNPNLKLRARTWNSERTMLMQEKGVESGFFHVLSDELDSLSNLLLKANN